MLAAAGASVVLGDIDVAGAQRVADAIVREGGDVRLDCPQLNFCTSDEISGRFAGFEKNLCPIT